MDIAPPPTGSRIQDLGDRLIVHFRPWRSWGALAFPAVWLTLWTGAGNYTFGKMLDADWNDRPFLIFWLCGWALGELVVAGFIAWQLFGRELLVVTREQLEVRKELGPYTRTKLYDVALSRDFTAAQVPSAEDEQPRKDFCLQFAYDGRTVHVGEGMRKREAEHVAATVSARIRPRNWWGEESPAGPYESPPNTAPAPPAAPQRHGLRVLSQIVFPVLVFAAIAGIAVAGHRDSHQPPPPLPTQDASRPRPPAPPPTEDQFASMRVYASAMTFYSLTSANTTVLGEPACTPRPTWSQWTCTVTARPASPPFAGRTLRYRCSAASAPPAPPLGGSSAARVTLCGPDPPPPIGD